MFCGVLRYSDRPEKVSRDIVAYRWRRCRQFGVLALQVRSRMKTSSHMN